MDNITFVDKNDVVTGYGTWAQAIENGVIHRIVRIFIKNSQGELLIQKRSEKVSLPGKWDQSAAGYVDEGENYLTAALREAKEEVGLTNTPLREIGKFYSIETDGAETKKRFNKVYEAIYDGLLAQDNDEVSEILWLRSDALRNWMTDKPEDFTNGFLQAYEYYSQNSSSNAQ